VFKNDIIMMNHVFVKRVDNKNRRVDIYKNGNIGSCKRYSAL